MPRPYPPEFRARAIALVRAGQQAKQTAVELGIHPVTLSKWLRQERHHPGSRLVTEPGAQMVGQVNLSPKSAADPARGGGNF
ncbi:transposase [Streptomyces sp. NBC_01016]|nr:transposase [Streptomyces sp. NBC_01016]